MTRLEELDALIAAGLGDVEPVIWMREVERLRSENARLRGSRGRLRRRPRRVVAQAEPPTELQERRWLLAELCGWQAQPWQERHAECAARRIA